VAMRGIHWRGALPRAVLLAVAVSLVPVPSVAGEAKADRKNGPIQASIQKVVARELAAMPARAAAPRHQAQTSTSKESVGFFKTGPGILVLVVMAVGTGYALYTTQNDRVKSPAKE